MERWANDPRKTVVYELNFKKHKLEPGSKFKIKYDSTLYTFKCLVHFNKVDEDGNETVSVWVEAMSENGFKSVRPENIYKVIKGRRGFIVN